MEELMTNLSGLIEQAVEFTPTLAAQIQLLYRRIYTGYLIIYLFGIGAVIGSLFVVPNIIGRLKRADPDDNIAYVLGMLFYSTAVVFACVVFIAEATETIANYLATFSDPMVWAVANGLVGF